MKYIIREDINVRVEPFANSRILRVAGKGEVVEVDRMVDDWLYLANDAGYIRFGCGLYAEKVED